MDFLDNSTFELGNSRLRLKDGLSFTLHKSGDKSWYMIDDATTGKFFRVGIAEYTLLSLLDGKRTLSEAVAIAVSLLGDTTLDETQGARICAWMIESGLAHSSASRSTERILKRQNKSRTTHAMQRLNPVSFQLPLFEADAMIGSFYRSIGWMFGWFGFVAWLVVCCYGMMQLGVHWREFSSERFQSFSQSDFIWITATWILLKAFHELAHALMCKRFGGQVGVFGLVFLLFVPLPYVDVTSSWQFERKSHRILTSAAGMMCELFIASLAVLVWIDALPGPLRFHASNIIIAASIHTLMFNANPLMRFDGYYILSDWLELPNLYTHGRQYVLATSKRFFFGSQVKLPEFVHLSAFIKMYGWLSMVWSILLTTSLLFGALSLFEGVGLLLALFGACLWILVPTLKLISFLAIGTPTEKPNRKHFLRVMCSIVAAVSVFAYSLPAPSIVRAPFVVDYDQVQVIRAEAPGFVEFVTVQPNQMVEQGDILMRLHNPFLQADLISIRTQIQESELRIRSHKGDGNVAASLMEEKNLQALKTRESELSELIDHLIVRAEIDGQVISSNLDTLTGSYIEKGHEIVSVANGSKKKALALVDQTDAKHLQATISKPTQLDVFGEFWKRHQGIVRQCEPRARDNVPHEAFSAANGGMLAVVPRAQVDSSPEKRGNTKLTSFQSDQWKLVEPRVLLTIEFNPTDSETLRSGQSGIAYLAVRNQSLGSYLADNFSRWVSAQIKRNHGL